MTLYGNIAIFERMQFLGAKKDMAKVVCSLCNWVELKIGGRVNPKRTYIHFLYNITMVTSIILHIVLLIAVWNTCFNLS